MISDILQMFFLIIYYRYASEEISNFLEECTVLDPRFKDSHIDPERLCTIYHRLPFICSAGGPLKVS